MIRYRDIEVKKPVALPAAERAAKRRAEGEEQPKAKKAKPGRPKTAKSKIGAPLKSAKDELESRDLVVPENRMLRNYRKKG